MKLLSRQLQAFLTVAQTGNVHAAAHALHLSQTAVTQRLQALEALLETTLFMRSRAGMKVTPEGQELLRYCRSAIDMEGAVLAATEQGGVVRQARVTIVGSTSITRQRVVPAVIDVLARFPTLLLTIEIVDLAAPCMNALRTGHAQLAILPRDQVGNELDSSRLKPERHVLVAPAAWKHRALPAILREERAVDFDETGAGTISYLRHFRLLAHAKRDRHFVNSTEAVAQMVIARQGFSVLTSETAQPYIERGEIITLNGGRAYNNALALAWFARPHLPPYLAALIQAIAAK
jgi:DNA-binding transcriptional LysR family regulator